MTKGEFWKWFNVVAGIASIVGVLYLLFNDKVNGIIALSIFVLFLISVIVLLWFTINKLIKTDYPQDYKKIIVFTSYETEDGVKGKFEVFKVIQAKKLVLDKIEHCYKWSGSKEPVVSSDLQEIGKKIPSSSDDYDKAILILKKPLSYNETGTIHFKAEIDDVDGKALPYLDHKVDTDMNAINFRVTLKYKDNNYAKPALLLKKPIKSNTPIGYKEISSVPFDKESKSYQYNLLNPEIGYFYRLEWEK